MLGPLHDVRVSYLNVGSEIRLDKHKDNGRSVTLTAVQTDYNYLSGNLTGTPGLTPFTQILMRKQ